MGVGGRRADEDRGLEVGGKGRDGCWTDHGPAGSVALWFSVSLWCLDVAVTT